MSDDLDEVNLIFYLFFYGYVKLLFVYVVIKFYQTFGILLRLIHIFNENVFFILHELAISGNNWFFFPNIDKSVCRRAHRWKCGQIEGHCQTPDGQIHGQFRSSAMQHRPEYTAHKLAEQQHKLLWIAAGIIAVHGLFKVRSNRTEVTWEKLLEKPTNI